MNKKLAIVFNILIIVILSILFVTSLFLYPVAVIGILLATLLLLVFASAIYSIFIKNDTFHLIKQCEYCEKYRFFWALVRQRSFNFGELRLCKKECNKI